MRGAGAGLRAPPPLGRKRAVFACFLVVAFYLLTPPRDEAVGGGGGGGGGARFPSTASSQRLAVSSVRAPRQLPPTALSPASSSSSSLSSPHSPPPSSSSASLALPAPPPGAAAELLSLDALGGRGAAGDCGARAEAEALAGGGRVVFFSFASGAYLASLRRILAEARATGVFDEVLGFTPEDIPRDYFVAHADVLNATRGRGFWAWKPYFLRRLLDRLAPGDVVMFADAGCEFTGNPQTYVDVARRYGFLGFRLPLWPKHAVKRESRAPSRARAGWVA
jgi:hypothetical protein